MSSRVVYKKKRNTACIFGIILITACLCTLVFSIIKSSAVATSAQITKEYEKYYKSVLVNADDNLWSIAEENMTFGYADKRSYINEIKSINHLSGDTIHSGEYICVPYYA